MKKVFARAVRSFGGTTSYSGNTETAVMSDKTQFRYALVDGALISVNPEKPVKVKAYAYSTGLGVHARKSLLGFNQNEPRTMYVKGLTQEWAEQLVKLFQGIKLPFNVVFQ